MLPNRHRLVAIVTFAFLVAACSSAAPTGPSAGPTNGEPQPTAPVSAPVSAPPSALPGTSETSAPTSVVETPGATTGTPVSAEPCGPGGAWVASEGYGLTCIDKDGWHAYTDETGPLTTNRIDALAACSDGSTWIATGQNLWLTDGTDWFDRSDLVTGKSIDHLTCDPNGGLWVGYYGGVGRIDSSGEAAWVASTELGTGKFVDQVKGIAVAADGTVWVVTANSVARLPKGKGSTWTVYEQGHGFSKLFYFEGIAVDPDGHPWVGHTEGVFSFDGKTWRNHTDRDLFQAKVFTVDAKGRIWAGTYAHGVSRWDGDSWTTFNRANSDLSSDYIHTLTTDARGRIWIGTEYGLSVLAGSTWTAFHMHTSALLDNEIGPLAVSGRGPTLPALASKQKGALAGTIVSNGSPQRGLTVQACVEFLGSTYTGSTPCSGQPLVKSAVTRTDGSFTITGLPVGRFSLAVEKPDGGWVRLTDQWKIGDRETLVNEGQTSDLGELDLTS